ncbi:MAG TPA: RDD family protein [Verrucomicrobiae bacterium]|jgi:uncharacterized RDD family membrane protein YckC|nr:RDD family protein [Verrucomicrobiae bacterium]
MRRGISLPLTIALGLLLGSQSTSMFAASDNDPPKERGVHREEIVSIGNDAELKAGDSAREVVVIGGGAKIAGNVERGVVAVGGDVEIDGDIGDDVVVVMGKVHLGPKAVLHHDLVTVGGAVEMTDGAKVEGRTQEVAVGLPFEPFLRMGWFKSWIQQCVWKLRPLSLQVGWVWWFAGGFFILYLLIAALFPHPVECCRNQLVTRPATTFAVGVMTKLLVPIICLLLPFTIIGILIVPFVLVGAFLTLLVGKAALLEFLGGKIAGPFGLKTEHRPLVALSLGAVLITLFYLAPVFGMVTSIVFSFWALGAAVTAGWVALRREKSPVILAPPPFAEPPTPIDPGAGAPPITPPQALAHPLAGFWERMGAGFLDMALILLLSALIGPISMLVAIAYFSGMWAWKGTTIGGIVLNLQVVREDGKTLSFLAAFVRSLAAMLSIAALFLGFFWIGWDRAKQGWHDKIAGTVVVRLPRAIPLVCI